MWMEFAWASLFSHCLLNCALIIISGGGLKTNWMLWPMWMEFAWASLFSHCLLNCALIIISGGGLKTNWMLWPMWMEFAWASLFSHCLLNCALIILMGVDEILLIYSLKYNTMKYYWYTLSNIIAFLSIGLQSTPTNIIISGGGLKTNWMLWPMWMEFAWASLFSHCLLNCALISDWILKKMVP